jgi:HEAT repeat protein
MFFSPNIIKLKEKQDIPALEKCLKDRNADTRLNAFLALFSLKRNDKKYLKNLRFFIDDKDDMVKAIALLKFLDLGEKDLSDNLYTIINKGSQRIKIEAMKTLVQQGKNDDPIISIIISLAVQDKKLIVRLEAIKAMGAVQSPTFIDQLIALLKERNFQIRQRAAQSLGAIGSEKAIDDLTGALTDNHRYVREAALEALESIDSDKARKALGDAPLRMLINSMNKNLESKQNTIRSIGKQNLLYGLPLLHNALNDEYKTVRIESLKALAQMKKKESISHVAHMLNDFYWDVRLEAVQTLESITHKDSLNALQKAYHDKNSNVVKAAKKSSHVLKERIAMVENSKYLQ